MRTRSYFLSFLFLFLSYISTDLESKAQESDSIKYSAYSLMTEYYSNNFHPFVKSNVYLGFAFSLKDTKSDNEQNLLFTTIEGDDIRYSVTLKGGYFLGDYLMVGANLSYDRSEFQGIVLSDSDTISREFVDRLVLVSPVLKSYFPLTKNHRLSFFNEIGVGVGFGKGVSRNTENLDEITKVNSDEFIFTAGISPGVTFFAIENFSFEIQLNNLIGYTYKQSSQTKNEVEEGKVVTNNVNFNVNLLALRLGLSYYFGTKKQR